MSQSNRSDDRLRVLLASTELHPYSKTGGLADMVGAMAKSLAKAGHRVGMVTPLYQGIQEQHGPLRKLDYALELPLGAETLRAEVFVTKPSRSYTIYFIHQPRFYQRASLYQEHGVSYPDNAQRFIFFSKCVTHLARFLDWQPELVHVHDWQSALVPLMMLHQHRHEAGGRVPRTCLTIHNLAYQGIFGRGEYGLTNLPDHYFNLHAAEFYGNLNCLKAGIVFADFLATVSPTYAREILTPEFGCGLEPVLKTRRASLRGILNGVDYDEWTTINNPYLKYSYSAEDLFGKQASKLELQKELGLPVTPHVPLFASITRLADQKGVDVLLAALNEMLALEMQFVLLGTGAPEYEAAFTELAARFPDQVSVHITFDQALSHRIEAGADFFVMPSYFEPCGLNQMYSQRYGTIPIVRRTGGLEDAVVDARDVPADEAATRTTGIKFDAYTVEALTTAMRKASELFFKWPQALEQMRRNAMRADHSWARTTTQYEALYREILDRKGQAST